jgi:interferon gamma-inducible protein 30
LEKPDMVAIIDLKLVAYGNAKQNADGSFTCQHGAGECECDAQHLCTQYKLSGDINSITTGDTSFAAWPFILCMEEAEGNPLQGQSCFESTMNSTQLSWSTVSTCVQEEFNTVTTAAKQNTPAHDYVPWCLVDGVVLENTNLLQKAICDAYTGVPPASCSRVTVSHDEVEVCTY